MRPAPVAGFREEIVIKNRTYIIDLVSKQGCGFLKKPCHTREKAKENRAEEADEGVARLTKDVAVKWLKQALHDLEIAKKNVAIGGYDTAAFLAHQAVEKLLKSFFAQKGQKIPRIHYIDVLARRLGVFDLVADEITDINADYMFARYPDVGENVPYEEYDEEIAAEKVAKAERVFALLKDYYQELLAEQEDQADG